MARADKCLNSSAPSRQPRGPACPCAATPFDFDISVTADKKRRARGRGFSGRGRELGAGLRAAGLRPSRASTARRSRPDNLEEFHWFCLDHVREYNLRWNFFDSPTPMRTSSGSSPRTGSGTGRPGRSARRRTGRRSRTPRGGPGSASASTTRCELPRRQGDAEPRRRADARAAAAAAADRAAGAGDPRGPGHPEQGRDPPAVQGAGQGPAPGHERRPPRRRGAAGRGGLGLGADQGRAAASATEPGARTVPPPVSSAARPASCGPAAPGRRGWLGCRRASRSRPHEQQRPDKLVIRGPSDRELRPAQRRPGRPPLSSAACGGTGPAPGLRLASGRQLRHIPRGRHGRPEGAIDGRRNGDARNRRST